MSQGQLSLGRTGSERFGDAAQWLLWSVRVGLLLVMLTPLVVTDSTLFPYVVGKALYARVMIEVSFGLWVLLLLISPQHMPRRSWVLAAFAIWVLVSAAAALMGASSTRSMWSTYERMGGVVDLLHWLAFVVMAASVFRTWAHWRWVLTISIGVCLLIAMLGIGQRYGLVESTVLASSSGRLEATLGNSGYLAQYMLVSVLFACALLVSSLGGNSAKSQDDRGGTRALRRGRRARRRARAESREQTFNSLVWLQTLWIVAIMLGLWAMWLTNARSGILALIVAFVVFTVAALVWSRARFALWVIGVGFTALLILTLLVLLFEPSDVSQDRLRQPGTIERLATTGHEQVDYSLQARVAAHVAGYHMFMERPLLGWGPENFFVSWGRYIDWETAQRETFDNAHNKLLGELTEKGALGLATYTLVWLAMLRAIVMLIVRREGWEQQGVIVFGAAMVAYISNNVFLFDTPVALMQFGIIGGLVVAAERWARAHDKKAEQGWLPNGVRERLRDRISGIGGGDAWRKAFGALLGTAVVAGVAMLVMVNARIYEGSVETVKMLRASEWDERLVHYEEAVAAFPGLANRSRLYFITEGGLSLEPDMTHEDVQQLAEVVEDAATEALALEPSNWLIAEATVNFYHAAGAWDRAYLEQARGYIDLMAMLAPNLVDGKELYLRQDRLEQISE